MHVPYCTLMVNHAIKTNDMINTAKEGNTIRLKMSINYKADKCYETLNISKDYKKTH